MNSCQKIDAQILSLFKHDKYFMHTCYTYIIFHAHNIPYFVHDIDFMHNGCASDSANAQKIPQFVQPTAALITNNTKEK